MNFIFCLRHWFLAAACVVLASRIAHANEEMVDTLISQIDSVPSWAEIPRGDGAIKKEPLLTILQNVAMLPTATVREVVYKLDQRTKSKEPRRRSANKVNTWSNIYVLLRLHFKVPEWEKLSNLQLFGGWVGIPRRQEFVNVSYPLKFDGSGQPLLVGPMGGYMGAPYQGAKEFDYFTAKYPLRYVVDKGNSRDDGIQQP